MAKTKISEFSATPASNTDIDSINIAEGCAPSGINDAIRELMAQLKDFQTGAVGDSFNGPVGTTTAAAGAFTTLAASGAVTLSGGTANGVPYLNGSKVLTTGSALTFDGNTMSSVALAAAGSTVSYNLLTLKDTGSTYSASNWFSAFTNSTNATVGALYHPEIQTLGISGASALVFGIGSTPSEQMRLTSTGLGIGTSSPIQKLHVGGTGNIYASGGATWYTGGDLFIRAGASGSLRLGANNANDFAILDSSGNLGLGVTPSAWIGAFKAIEVSSAGSVSSISDELGLNANSVYLTGTNWTYKATGLASQYRQSLGQHRWYTAPSGTAGNAITFTQAMTLDASGFFFLGCTTTPSATVAGIRLTPDFTTNTPKFSAGSATGLVYMVEWINGNGIVGSIATNGSATLYNVTSDYRLKDIDGPITTSGAFIDSLKPVQGSWKADGSRFIGFLAHELQEASETVVGTGVKDGEEMQSIDYSNAELIANLVAELKALRARIAALEAA